MASLGARGVDLAGHLHLRWKVTVSRCRTQVTLLVESCVRVWVPRAGDTCGLRQVETDPSC